MPRPKEGGDVRRRVAGDHGRTPRSAATSSRTWRPSKSTRRDRLVRERARVRDVGAERGDRQDAAPGGDEAGHRPSRRRAVEHDDAVERIRELAVVTEPAGWLTRVDGAPG